MRHAVAFALLCATLAASPRAWSQASVEQAKVFFDAGATAYARGDFRAAIQAFEEAYRISARPAILFSMAQAYRRQYFVDRRPQDLRHAVDLYRQYVTKVPSGGRKADAVQALSELELPLSKLGADAGDSRSPLASSAQTRVMVTSSVKDAKASLDGAAPVELPLIAEVKPGKHNIRVFADGYFEEKRDVIAVEGNLIPNDVPLREKPARLTVKARDGAQIAVDGRPVGTTPLSRPVEVAPGRHLITVTRNGARAFAVEVDFAHDQDQKIDAALPLTGQRIAAFTLFGVGAAGVVAGGVAAGIAVQNQAIASDVLAKHAKGNILPEELASYNRALQLRDDWRRVAVAGLAAGGAIAATGFLLYAFDQPVLDLRAPRRDDGPKKPGPKRDDTPLEVSAVPLAAPGLAGALVIGRF